MVRGQSYRLGQVGAFVRIPLGYSSLYGVCTQVGADAAPSPQATDSHLLEEVGGSALTGHRWMTVALFGESLGGQFDRGIGQHPTVGDEVHLVTSEDLDVIYGDLAASESVNQSPTAGERAGEGAVIEARHEWLRSGRVDRRCGGQSGGEQGVRPHGWSIAAPVPVHQVAGAVAAARRTTARMRLWARANQSRIARAFWSPRTPMWRRPRLRAIALTHSAVAARSR